MRFAMLANKKGQYICFDKIGALGSLGRIHACLSLALRRNY